MAKRQLSPREDLPPTFTLREVQTTARPRSTAGTFTVTLGSEFSATPTEHERLVKRTRRDLEDEGPSGDRKVLPQYPLEYKEDEEESEGETYLSNSEEERMAYWTSEYSCHECGRVETFAQGWQTHPYCSTDCQDRGHAAYCQDCADNKDWYLHSYPNSPSLLDYFIG